MLLLLLVCVDVPLCSQGVVACVGRALWRGAHSNAMSSANQLRAHEEAVAAAEARALQAQQREATARYVVRVFTVSVAAYDRLSPPLHSTPLHSTPLHITHLLSSNETVAASTRVADAEAKAASLRQQLDLAEKRYAAAREQLAQAEDCVDAVRPAAWRFFFVLVFLVDG